METNDKGNNKEAQFEYIRRLIHTKLDCGKDILELSTYKDISMWWCVDTLFYNTIFSLTSSPRKAFFRKCFITFYMFGGFYFEVLYDIVLASFIKCVEYIYMMDKRAIGNQRKIIFLAQDLQWKTTQNYETGQLRRTDAFFDSVLKALDGLLFSPIGVYPITNYPIRGLKVYMEKLNKWDIIHIALNQFWSIDTFKEQCSALYHFRKQFSEIKSDIRLKEICGKNYNCIINEFELYFKILFPYQMKLMMLTKHMIKHMKPDLMLLLNEYSWVEKSMLITAKIEKIPILAIQHGIITPVHKGYMYDKNEIHPRLIAKSPYCPIPDMTAVYGRYYYDLLTKESAYPKNAVAITGQPRYDALYYAKNIYSKELFIKKYRIEENSKIVLWTTQCHGLSDEENRKNFNVVFKTFQDIKNVTLVIKQHPGEGKRYTKMILRYLNQYKITAIMAPKESDVFELIYACDLMITKHSTTAIEAVALNKPIIVLDMEDKNDLGGYVAQGVALGVFYEGDLQPTIQNLLKDDSELAINRKNYIERYLYKIDGQSTNRVVEIIRKMIGIKQERLI